MKAATLQRKPRTDKRKSENKKEFQVGFRLNAKEFGAMEKKREIMELHGMSVSTVIRAILIRELTRDELL